MPRFNVFSVATTTTRAATPAPSGGQTKNPGKSGIENGRQAEAFRETKTGRRKGGHSSDPGCREGEFFCSGAGAMAEMGTVEPQLDGDLRRIRSGEDLGILYQSCHDLNRGGG